MNAPPDPIADFPRSDVALDADLTQAWALAAWIGSRSPEQTLRSFGTMLVP